MATYKNVGGQIQVMDPTEVARKQQLAKMLMQGGQDTSNIRHWSEALGSVLQTGMGSYLAGDASRGQAQGQQSGNAALAAQLMGKDPNAAAAAVANPYSSERAMKFQMDQASPVNDPAIVKTHKYRQGLPENERQDFDQVQRAQRFLDTETSFVNPRTGETINKNLFQAEREKGLGAAQVKGEVSWPKTEIAYEQSKLQDQFVVEDIDTALKQAGPWTTGFAGSVGKFVAGSPQSDLAFSLQSIEANLAFDKLQAIRDASPTGGALGAITERELDLLKSTWGSIAQAQSQEQFMTRLQRLKQIKAQYAVLKERAYEEDKRRFGPAAVPNPNGGQAAPQGGGVDLKSKYGLE
jgi:hypothetical protein